MAVRREFEEYWGGVGEHFERARPEVGEEAWRRARPAEAAQRDAALLELGELEARLRAAEAARDSLRQACAAEEEIRGLADRAERAFREMRGRGAEPAGAGSGKGGDNFPGRWEPAAGRREHFLPPSKLPREANTAFPPGPDVWGQGRARSERWGTNPLLGGGSTIQREEGRLEYARLRGQLAERSREVEQDAELRAGVAKAVRLYREGRGAADAGL